MAERTERQVLHHLIEVCKDGEHGFLTAADQADAPQLKSLCTELAKERADFAAALVPHLQRLGETSDDEEGSHAAALHRRWMNIKGFVAVHHDHAIVTEAERGEQAALHAYEDALNGMLPPTVTSLVEAQRDAVRHANERLRSIDMGHA
jgi:uncharacterized protein (TIGR02284 family)